MQHPRYVNDPRIYAEQNPAMRQDPRLQQPMQQPQVHPQYQQPMQQPQMRMQQPMQQPMGPQYQQPMQQPMMQPMHQRPDPRYQDPRYQMPMQDPRFQDPRYQDPRYQMPAQNTQDPRMQHPTGFGTPNQRHHPQQDDNAPYVRGSRRRKTNTISTPVYQQHPAPEPEAPLPQQVSPETMVVVEDKNYKLKKEVLDMTNMQNVDDTDNVEKPEAVCAVPPVGVDGDEVYAKMVNALEANKDENADVAKTCVGAEYIFANPAETDPEYLNDFKDLHHLPEAMIMSTWSRGSKFVDRLLTRIINTYLKDYLCDDTYMDAFSTDYGDLVEYVKGEYSDKKKHLFMEMVSQITNVVNGMSVSKLDDLEILVCQECYLAVDETNGELLTGYLNDGKCKITPTMSPEWHSLLNAELDNTSDNALVYLLHDNYKYHVLKLESDDTILVTRVAG